MKKTYQIINTIYDCDLIEVVLFNTQTAKTFTLCFKAENFDSWASANISEELLIDLWDFYRQSPSLFQRHIERFVFSEIEKGLAA